MRFVDEATIKITAGKGGNGCLGFRREKNLPKGGPNGGDGGAGGSVLFIGCSGLNTLADFRYTRRYKAENGQPGGGRDCSGRKGSDSLIKVPLGTLAYDADTSELIGEVVTDGEKMLVAQGGQGGLGNSHFKTSVNRTPRRTTPGTMGDERNLRLELKVLADVGLLGLPNAGKSTFLRAVSNARPRVADYPFTTLYPNLGVVDVGHSNSFVVADIPGLIEGAAQGAGLGIAFLKHLQRTLILLHLVNIAPLDGGDPVDSIRQIETELAAFDASLAQQERWLVLSKADLVAGDSQLSQQIKNKLLERLAWTAPCYLISAVTGHGCDRLVQDLMRRLNALKENENSNKIEYGLSDGVDTDES